MKTARNLGVTPCQLRGIVGSPVMSRQMHFSEGNDRKTSSSRDGGTGRRTGLKRRREVLKLQISQLLTDIARNPGEVLAKFRNCLGDKQDSMPEPFSSARMTSPDFS
jgi:hypothetical protein